MPLKISHPVRTCIMHVYIWNSHTYEIYVQTMDETLKTESMYSFVCPVHKNTNLYVCK